MEAKDIQMSGFTELFLRYRDKYIALANSYIHDLPVSEDIVVDAFTKFWASRETLQLTSSPEAYILAMVRNASLNHLRDKAIHDKAKKTILADLEALQSDDLQWLFGEDVERIFRSFLDTLPEDSRNIFQASRFDDLTYKQIAEKYGITQRKVKREISKVLHAIRIALKDYLPALVVIYPGLMS